MRSAAATTDARPLVRNLISALTVLLLVSSCAIPTDPSPRVIAQSDVPPGLANPKRTVQVYLLRTSKFVAVRRTIPFGGGKLAIARAALVELNKALFAKERSEGFESKVSKLDIPLTGIRDSVAYLDVTKAPSLLDDPFALGQVVLTLTDLRGIDAVDFRSSGENVEAVIVSGYESVQPPVGKDSFEALRQVQDIARVYFVRDGKLVAVERRIEDPSIDDDAEALADKYLTPFGETTPKGYESPVSVLKPTLRCISDEEVSTNGSVPSTPLREPGQPDCSIYLKAKEFRSMLPDAKMLAIGQVLYTLGGWRTRAELGKVWVFMQPEDDEGNACTPIGGAPAAAGTGSSCAKRQMSIPTPDGGSVSEIEKVDYESLLSTK